MGLQLIELTGTPVDMGRAHGEHLRQAIHDFAERRLEVAAAFARRAGRKDGRDDVLDFCRSLIPEHKRHMPGVYEEFAGIAEGAGIPGELLMIANGLTDIVDVYYKQDGHIGECTSWLAAPEATVDSRVLAGQTWDMHPWAKEFLIAVLRRPVEGPASLALTTAGCLSLVGVNEVGIAVGNNNLRPTDARPGLMYLAIVHQALAEKSLAAAINTVVGAIRLSGHNYYLAGPDGEIVDIETTARHSEVITPAGSFYAHTNHYLSPRLSALEMSNPSESSLFRLERMQRMLHDSVGEISPDTMMRAMADEVGHGDCRVCRTDPNDKNHTCAAVVMSPQTGKMWACHGAPSQNAFQVFQL